MADGKLKSVLTTLYSDKYLHLPIHVAVSRPRFPQGLAPSLCYWSMQL